MSVVQKIFGTHSEREIRRINGLVEKIESMRPEMMELTDEQIGELAYKCTYMGQRMIGGIKKLGKDDIARIYEMAR